MLNQQDFSLQNFVKFSVKDRFIMLEESTMKVAGFSCIINKGTIHDTEVFDYIIGVTSKMKDDDIYIDAGAAIGDTSLWTTKGTCFAFEPGKTMYRCLMHNLKHNPTSKVIPINRAVYSSAIPYKHLQKGDHRGLDKIKKQELSETKAIVLDEMFANVPNIKMIKIDCEGADLEVLRGAKNIIMENRPLVILEAEHIDKLEMFKILEKLNYNYQLINISCIAYPKEGPK